MTIESTSDRERLLDELGRCFVRAALNQLLADPDSLNEIAAASKRLNDAEHTPVSAAEAT